MEVLSGDGYEILGVSVFDTGPIRAGVHLQLSTPVTALYGLNGAGKSRLLAGVTSAMTGVRLPVDPCGSARLPAAHLHIRLTSGAETPLADALALAVRDGAAGGDAPPLRGAAAVEQYLVSPDEDPPGTVYAAMRQRLASLFDAADADSDLVTALAGTRHFTLIACGTTGAPRWRVAPALPVVEPVWKRELQALAAWLPFVAAARETLKSLDNDRDAEEIERVLDALLGSEPALAGRADEHCEAYLEGDDDRLRGLPRWLAVPFRSLGSFSERPVHVVGSRIAPDQLDRDGLAAVRREAAATDSGGNLAALRGSAEHVQALAREMLAQILLDAPRLHFDVGSPEGWLAGSTPGWSCAVGDAVQLPLNALSAAQQRWAGLAIALAVADRHSLPVVFVCDEPENGLHRQAEARLSSGLSNIVDRAGALAVVATHSPFLLDAPSVSPVLVYRTYEDERSALRPVPRAMLDALDVEDTGKALGLTAGSMLEFMRIAVLVEGVHDESVVRQLYGSDLAAVGASIVPLRGVKGVASLAEARLLFQATAAPILLVVDGVSTPLSATWEIARRHAEAGRSDEARAALLRINVRNQGEARWLKELGILAVDTGRMDRIHLHGMTQRDIVCYLPPESLLVAGRTWVEAERAYLSAVAGRSAVVPAFKTWLVGEKWASTFSPHAVDAAARLLAKRVRKGEAVPHPDLEVLRAAIVALAAKPPGRG